MAIRPVSISPKVVFAAFDSTDDFFAELDKR